MFSYEPNWSDAAVRRFIRRIAASRATIDDLLDLREADNVGSGLPASAGGLDELRRRIAAESAAGVVLDLRGLAIDGDDLMGVLGVAPGPRLGEMLDDLLDRVIAEPSLNDRQTLLDIARTMATEER